MTFIGWINKAGAQDTILNKYGLWVISSVPVYSSTVRQDPAKKMVDISKLVPGIVFDLRYSTTNNFLQKKLYPGAATSFLRYKAAQALALIQKKLAQQGLGLKIFDAYRPYSVTEQMWETVQDERYAANPKKGSGHNRGAAVDLTLIELATGKELDMGTGFDNFSDTAHHDFMALPTEILQNRLLLKTTMEKFGFRPLDTEWWHYFLPDIKEYELLDLKFEDLGKLQKRK